MQEVYLKSTFDKVFHLLLFFWFAFAWESNWDLVTSMVPPKMASKEQAQKFFIDDSSLPRSG